MKILVTGGSGFIGSHVIDKLVDLNYEVINFDISKSEYMNSKAVFIKEDVMNLEALKEAARNIDYIIHLAAQANVDFMIKSPVYSTKINTIGTLNVLEAARKNKVKKILFASTDWVYGGSTETNVDENTKLYPPTPDHIYTSSKIAAEMYIRNYKKLFNVNFTIMRFGIPFGPRGKRTTVTPIFLRKAFNREQIVIHGSGEQFRQFIYIDDLVAGIIACLKSEADNKIVNLNGLKKITIKMIADTINELFSNKLEIKYLEGRKGDFKGKLVNITTTTKLLEWMPKIEYEEAMKKYIDWFKQHEL